MPALNCLCKLAYSLNLCALISIKFTNLHIRTNEMANTPAITPKMNMYVGTAMTLKRVTPDCITVPLSTKIARELKIIGENLGGCKDSD